jgi:CheY-like chemotaxis protein
LAINHGEVLIVDADASIRGLLATIVRRLLRQPVLTADGKSALELLTSRDFDAVILELMLAGISGLDVIARVGQSKPRLLPRIVVVTTSPPAHWSKCQEMKRVAAVLRKPFAIEELQRVLRQCCEGGRSGDQ